MFLHGWGCDHKTLMPFINKLKENHTCICFDFFGFGKSKCVSKPLTLKDYKSAVVTSLKRLGYKKVDILAHSFGARVALMLASENEIEIGKMFLVGPAGIKPKFSLKTFIKIRFYKFLKFLSRLRLYPKAKLEKWGSDDYKNLSPEMKQTFKNVISVDLKDRLPKISAETFVVIGRNDCATPVYMGKILKKKIKNCRFEIVEDAGHFCFLEKTSVSFLAYCFFK